jgi:hypothetical protein
MWCVAKWVCACGGAIQSSGPIPHPYQWLLTSDQDFEAFTDLVRAEDLYSNATVAFRCPQCDRLHVFWRGMDGDATVYAPE